MSNVDISTSTLIHARPNQVSCDLAGEAAILNMDSGIYFGLDPVGARIWALLQESRTIGSVCDTLMQEYDVDAARCEKEVIAVVRRMEENGLVEAGS